MTDISEKIHASTFEIPLGHTNILVSKITREGRIIAVNVVVPQGAYLTYEDKQRIKGTIRKTGYSGIISGLEETNPDIKYC